MKTKRYPGDPRKNFTWRGIKFTRNTDRRNQCPLDFTSDGYWIHPYEIRAPGPYGSLTGKYRWVAHTPLSVPGPSGCIGGHSEGHGTSPIKALEDALKSAETQAHKVAVQLVQAMTDIKKLKDAA